MKLKHLKTINELYSDTYRSARDKTENIDKKKAFNTAYVNKFLEEGGDISDIIDDIIDQDFDLDPSIDLSDDKYIIDRFNERLIENCLRVDSKHLIPLTKNKSIIDSITELYCSDNKLTSLNGIENLTNLRYLNCSDNELTDLKGIENLTNLKYLSCSDNKLTSLNGIENLTNLKLLYCRNNLLTSLNGIENLTNLKYLDCPNNPLNPPYSGDIKTEQERLKQL